MIPEDYHHGHRISVISRQVDQRWRATITIVRLSGRSETSAFILRPDEAFDTERAADVFGLKHAKDWVDHHLIQQPTAS